MVIEMPTYETFEKVHRFMKYYFKPFLGCRACNLAATVYPPLSLAGLTQHATSKQDTARLLSTVLSLPRVFEFKIISLILF
jgi:hypothetical protein